MKCTTCNEVTISGEICVYCRGERARQPTQVMSGEQWARRLAKGSQDAISLLRVARARGFGPGETVLALMMAALSIIEEIPELPSFDWYAEHLSKLPRAVKGERPS